MSEDLRSQLQNLSADELIDLALTHLGEEHTTLRQAALQEHAQRTKNSPDTQYAPAGDVELLAACVACLTPPASA